MLTKERPWSAQGLQRPPLDEDFDFWLLRSLQEYLMGRAAHHAQPSMQPDRGVCKHHAQPSMQPDRVEHFLN